MFNAASSEEKEDILPHLMGRGNGHKQCAAENNTRKIHRKLQGSFIDNNILYFNDPDKNRRKTPAPLATIRSNDTPFGNRGPVMPVRKAMFSVVYFLCFTVVQNSIFKSGKLSYPLLHDALIGGLDRVGWMFMDEPRRFFTRDACKVWCDLATSHALVLPHCGASWNEFLTGTGQIITTIWNYAKYLEAYAKAVRARKFKHASQKATAYKRSTTSQPRPLGQFTIPSKSRPSPDSSVISSE
ncbi:MAG: hypothetical protein J3Q66DRAFT_423034 [Benniella sp.]|nr:MAG: hypothetical protein J3Q66DRAFT_423034 [Benniella sp.]